MSVKIVTYDLHKDGQNYDDLIIAIKSFRAWAKINQSVWAVQSNLRCAEIRNKLKPYIDSNDRLFVAELSGDAAWTGLPVEVSNWLNSFR